MILPITTSLIITLYVPLDLILIISEAFYPHLHIHDDPGPGTMTRASPLNMRCLTNLHPIMVKRATTVSKQIYPQPHKQEKSICGIALLLRHGSKTLLAAATYLPSLPPSRRRQRCRQRSQAGSRDGGGGAFPFFGLSSSRCHRRLGLVVLADGCDRGQGFYVRRCASTMPVLQS